MAKACAIHLFSDVACKERRRKHLLASVCVCVCLLFACVIRAMLVHVLQLDITSGLSVVHTVECCTFLSLYGENALHLCVCNCSVIDDDHSPDKRERSRNLKKVGKMTKFGGKLVVAVWSFAQIFAYDELKSSVQITLVVQSNPAEC